MYTDIAFSEIAEYLTLILLSVSLVLAFIRIVRGPTAADRIASLDLIAVLIVSILAAFAAFTGEDSFLDVTIAYALIAFLGTVALSRFLIRSNRAEKRTNNEENRN